MREDERGREKEEEGRERKIIKKADERERENK